MSVLTGKLQWVALGAGILILAAGLSVYLSISMFRRDQGTNSLPLANEVMPAGLETVGELPDLPPRNTTASDLAGPDSGSVDPGMSAAEDVAMSDSAELEIREQDPPAPRGGPAEVASFQDGADLVVRDAEGNVKQQETVR